MSSKGGGGRRKDGEERGEKKRRRSCKDTFNYLKWTSSYDLTRMKMGIKDFKAPDGILLLPFLEWRPIPEGEIPWHRVISYVYLDTVIWTKEIDQVDQVEKRIHEMGEGGRGRKGKGSFSNEKSGGGGGGGGRERGRERERGERIPKQLQLKEVKGAALCILPPEERWEQINSIREKHDKSFPSWMPHINIVWPFVDRGHFPLVKDLVEEVLSSLPLSSSSLSVRLGEFYYNQGSKYLEVAAEVVGETAETEQKKQQGGKAGKKKKEKVSSTKEICIITQIRKELKNCFGFCEENTTEWRPHLTVGQFPQNEIEHYRKKLQSNWEPIEFKVTHLSLIFRESSSLPFNVVDVIPLPDDDDD